MSDPAIGAKPSKDIDDTPPGDALASAQRTLGLEIDGLKALDTLLRDGLGASFAAAVDTIRAIPGRVVVTGMGKSGHVGRKIAATLASTGTPAFFVHPGEASHGDLGMVTAADAILALSWSGETRELAAIMSYSRRFRVPLIAVTAKPSSALGRAADILFALPAVKEACPHGLAPTTSTLIQMALGDALAIALLESRGFTAGEFSVFHPGGRLGASLQFVSDLMHTGERLPLAPVGTPMSEAIVSMTQKGFGCLGITDPAGNLVGIITDGDLRRHLTDGLLDLNVEDVMTRSPKTVAPDVMVQAALDIVNSSEITTIFVVEDGRPIGIVHMHDFLRAGVA